MAITPDSSGNNRKIAKKSRISFPVLSDDSGEWMKAYRLTAVGQQEKMAFLIEPELGQVSCFDYRAKPKDWRAEKCDGLQICRA